MAALEQKKSYFVAKDFKGINSTNNRTAIGEGEFSWLENTQPIGFGNVRIVNAPDTIDTVTFANTVTYMASANIQNTEFLFAFQQDGSAQYVNIENNTQGNLAAANTFSNSNVQIVQWKNERILIIDPANGYKTWDGTNLVDIGSVGQSQSMTVVAITPTSQYRLAPPIRRVANRQRAKLLLCQYYRRKYRYGSRDRLHIASNHHNYRC
jgi:hypothetical protein